MINPRLASIIVNPYYKVRSPREPIGPNQRLLEAAAIPERCEKRCRVVTWSKVDPFFCGDKGLQEPECAS